MSDPTPDTSHDRPVSFGPPGRRRSAVAMFAGNTTIVAITVVQAFVLVPLSLRAFGAELYGAWVAAAELLLWAQQFEAGITHLLTQRVGAAVAAGRLRDAERWSATCLWLVGVMALGLMAVGMVAAPFVVTWLQAPSADARTFVAAFRVGLIASAILLVGSVVTALARGVQQPMIPTVAGVVGAVCALVVSIALLIAGYGLWSLAFGLLLRAAVVAAGSMLFLWRLPQPLSAWVLRPSREVADDVRGLLPSMAGGSAGYLLANNSEIVLVTSFYGPAAGATYALTRRAIDGVRSLVENVGLAAAPGLAHLVAADDRHRARQVVRELLWLRLAAACIGAAVVAAVNAPFVTLLFGGEHFGGVVLTVLFAVQMVVGGQAGLLNHVLRSAGRVSESAWLRMIEAACRVVAISIGLFGFGLAGAPGGALLVSVVTWSVTRNLVHRALPPESAGHRPGEGVRPVLVALLVLAAGIGIGIAGREAPLPAIGAAAATMVTAGAAVLWVVRPRPSRATSRQR